MVWPTYDRGAAEARCRSLAARTTSPSHFDEALEGSRRRGPPRRSRGGGGASDGGGGGASDGGGGGRRMKTG